MYINLNHLLTLSSLGTRGGEHVSLCIYLYSFQVSEGVVLSIYSLWVSEEIVLSLYTLTFTAFPCIRRRGPVSLSI